MPRMGRRPRESVLRGRRDAGLEGLSLRPPEISIAPRTAEEDILAAYCPIVEGRCGDMDCKGCPELKEEVPDALWLCSACAGALPALPFWGAGECAGCGDYSSFLLAVMP